VKVHYVKLNYPLVVVKFVHHHRKLDHTGFEFTCCILWSGSQKTPKFFFKFFNYKFNGSRVNFLLNKSKKCILIFSFIFNCQVSLKWGNFCEISYKTLQWGIEYLTLMSVLSLNNSQNSEMKICEIWSWHVENHHNYHRLHPT
jgi:hypothetical protein